MNIAEPIPFGGDLSTMVKVLRKHPQTMASHPILLLSVNLESLNDLGFTGRPVATLLDWTPYGRQEEWEDSPTGWPQSAPYVWWRRHDEY